MESKIEKGNRKVRLFTHAKNFSMNLLWIFVFLFHRDSIQGFSID